VERWLRIMVRFRWLALAMTALLIVAGVLAMGLHTDTSANTYI
jgi:hypothetical protein